MVMQDAKVRTAKRKRQRKKARATGLKLAPGDLEIVQAFVNTVARGKRGDELATPGRLALWLERRGLLDPGTALGETERRRAHEARSDLRAMLAANRGAEVDAATLQRLEQATTGGRLAVRYDDQGPAGFGPAGRGFDDALAALAAIVATARLEGLWPQMKLCARKGCGRAFFDTAVNYRGRWCSPQCGDRVRAEAYRRRQRRRKL